MAVTLHPLSPGDHEAGSLCFDDMALIGCGPVVPGLLIRKMRATSDACPVQPGT